MGPDTGVKVPKGPMICGEPEIDRQRIKDTIFDYYYDLDDTGYYLGPPTEAYATADATLTGRWKLVGSALKPQMAVEAKITWCITSCKSKWRPWRKQSWSWPWSLGFVFEVQPTVHFETTAWIREDDVFFRVPENVHECACMRE